MRKDIIADVESGAKVASGGKSGTSPLRSSKFAPCPVGWIGDCYATDVFLMTTLKQGLTDGDCQVVKLIDPIEHKMLHHLLHKLKGSRHFEHQAVANPLNTRDENGN